jgi:hypothetical protein
MHQAICGNLNTILILEIILSSSSVKKLRVAVDLKSKETSWKRLVR